MKPYLHAAVAFIVPMGIVFAAIWVQGGPFHTPDNGVLILCTGIVSCVVALGTFSITDS